MGAASAGCGANSGTMRVTRRPAPSRACTALRSQIRLQAATHAGAPARAPGSSAKCSSSGSSSSRSSSRPLSTERRRTAPLMLPWGNVIWCQESAAAGTPRITSSPLGSSAGGALPWERSLRPSLDQTAQPYSPPAGAGGDGTVTISRAMAFDKGGHCRRMVHIARYKFDSVCCPWRGRSRAFYPISVTKSFRFRASVALTWRPHHVRATRCGPRCRLAAPATALRPRCGPAAGARAPRRSCSPRCAGLR